MLVDVELAGVPSNDIVVTSEVANDEVVMNELRAEVDEVDVAEVTIAVVDIVVKNTYAEVALTTMIAAKAIIMMSRFLGICLILCKFFSASSSSRVSP